MKKGLIIALLLTLLVPVVSAEILLSQPDSLYNVGDIFNMDVVVSPGVNTNDFFIASLVCAGGEAEIYKVPISVGAGDAKEISISAKLDRFLIGNLNGDCFIKARYKDDSAESQKFDLNSNVKVDFEIDGVLFDPGETIKFTGSAIKTNGDALEGFVEITISGMNISMSNPVDDGRFEANFTIANDVPGGSYQLTVRAYEKDSSGSVTNEGSSSILIRVKSIVKSVDIALSEESISPGEELVYTALLYDQAGSELEDEEVALIITKPDNSEFVKQLVKTGDANSLITESNYAPGYWKVETEIGDLGAAKQFYVEELRNISTELEGDILVVTNTGNVPYDKFIEVTIGDVTELKEVNLKVGEVERVRLFAPDGEYDIGVKYGEGFNDLGTAFLTGSAVSVGGMEIKTGYIVTGLIILIIIAAAIVVYVVRKRRRDSMVSPGPISVDKKDKAMESAKTSSSIESGKKEETSVISLHIKNLEDLKKLKSKALDKLNEVLLKAKNKKAKIYVDGNYRVIIFSPLMTQQKEGNEIRTIKIAKDIETTLNEFNRKSPEKIEYGLGVNVGEMIVEKKEGKLRFVSLGKTLTASKKMSEASDKRVLISDDLHRRVIGNIKSEKSGKNNYWTVKKITNREKYADFVRGFVNRQKAERKRETAKAQMPQRPASSPATAPSVKEERSENDRTAAKFEERLSK